MLPHTTFHFVYSSVSVKHLEGNSGQMVAPAPTTVGCLEVRIHRFHSARFKAMPVGPPSQGAGEGVRCQVADGARRGAEEPGFGTAVAAGEYPRTAATLRGQRPGSGAGAGAFPPPGSTFSRPAHRVVALRRPSGRIVQKYRNRGAAVGAAGRVASGEWRVAGGGWLMPPATCHLSPTICHSTTCHLQPASRGPSVVWTGVPT
jgi:hypothetical protein